MTAVVTQAPPCLARYRVEGVLGLGPCGTVFKAHDPIGERSVAIKALKREVAVRALGPRLLEQA
ncbi:MAG TPA: hypothetical protein VH328_08380, partial [Burkholderiaceae bacterium]|nr:hypothetical protein [Burkholderiaceae bacterium]